ncbi:hypothetical protein [Legionella sp. CNM-4043-24]|uniref:hypothetical protein n=1 Tax=Legionella sp. CNM-4043-24 TaxID=3421646 RepID=UPI00403B361F
MPTALPYLENKSLLLMTEVSYGFGDFFAAKKMIRQLNSLCPGLTIHWQIRTFHNRMSDIAHKVEELKKIFSDAVAIELMGFEDQMSPVARSDIDLILFYPTIGLLSPAHFQQFKAWHVPMLQVNAYDRIDVLSVLPNIAELSTVNTGFDGLGLFLDDVSHGPQVPDLESILPEPFRLDPRNTLFFSYTAQDTRHAINAADFNHYVKIALDIAAPDQCVDVVANSPGNSLAADFHKYVWEHGFSEIQYLSRDKNRQIRTRVYSSPSAYLSPKVLRIMDPFPLTPQQMQALMIYAHPFQQATGEQSLSEMMSLSSIGKAVFPFYQTLSWNVGLHENWCLMAEACLGKNSAYVRLLQSTASGKEIDIQGFSQTWRDNQSDILADARSLSHSLFKDNNLNHNVAQFLDRLFFVAASFSPQRFSINAALLVQLQIKLKDAAEITQIVCRLNESHEVEQSDTAILALTEFLKLNPVAMDIDMMHTLVSQFLAKPGRENIFSARTARQIMASLPASLRQTWALRLIPELQSISTGLHHLILKETATIDNPETSQQCSDWIERVFDKHRCWEQSDLTKTSQNPILLAVNVYNDGVGDLVKYIGVYRQIKQAFPGVNIISLIQCLDESRPVLLAMLRENHIPLKEVHLWSLSHIEQSRLKNGLISKSERDRLLNRFSFSKMRKYALIISVATPFREINTVIREYYQAKTPYIEIAEINYSSYARLPKLLLPQDAQHQIFAAGLSKDAAGLEISDAYPESPEQLIRELTPSLARQLLDAEPDAARIAHFLEHVFFMPAYLKYDEGIMSLHFALALMEHHVKEKDTAVMWINQLPFDIRKPSFTHALKAQGIALVVIHSEDGSRQEYHTEASGTKVLRLVCGRVSQTDFDRMFQLAQFTGGFGGCVGQNSFEKAVSFNLVPAFYAPPWLMSLIYQCQSLISNLFPLHSPEWRVVNGYLQLLSSVSDTIRITDWLLKNEDFAPWLAHLKSLEPGIFQQELNRIANELIPSVARALPWYFPIHPVEQVQAFLEKEDLDLLQSAWKEVCSHIRQNKNLNLWLVKEVQNYLPTGFTEDPEPVQLDEPEKALAILHSHHLVSLAPEQHLETMSLLRQLLETIWPAHEKQGLQLFLTGNNDDFVEIIPGLDCPTIAISMAAFERLTIGELSFGLKTAAEIFKQYPIETRSFQGRNMSQEELLRGVKQELPFGMSYCRRLIELLKTSEARVEQEQGRTGYYYALGQKREFYVDLIKNVELLLAREHRYTIGQDIPQRDAAWMQQHPVALCHGEIASIKAAWCENDGLSEVLKPPVEALHDLIETIPSLRIRNPNEYNYPSLAAQKFLRALQSLTPDAEIPEVAMLLERLVEEAFQHRLACFDAIYRWVSSILAPNSAPIPLGPFRLLQNLIQVFASTTDYSTALDHARQIEHFLKAKETRYLFVNSPRLKPLHNYYDGDNDSVDAFICSTIGACIDWTRDFYLPCEGSESFERYLDWCTQDSSAAIARVLFRAGMMAEKPLWRFLSSEFINDVIGEKEPILGQVPAHWQNHIVMRSVIKKQLSFDFLHAHLACLYETAPVLMPEVLSRETIEHFIEQHKTLLSIPEIHTTAATQLMRLLESFMINEPEQGRNLIRQFYIDPQYMYGLYQLAERRTTFPHFRSGFKLRMNNADKHYSTENSEDNPYAHFLLKFRPDFIPLEDLLDSMNATFICIFAYWPLDFFLQILKLRIDEPGYVIEAVNTLQNHHDRIRSYGGKCYIRAAINNLYQSTATKLQSIHLFSETTLRFIQQAGEHGADQRNLCLNLWARPGFANEVFAYQVRPLPDLSTLSQLYKIFDCLVTWPDNRIRDQFSAVILQELANADRGQQSAAINILLFHSLPLTDMFLANELVSLWGECQLNLYGKDDRSYGFYLNLSRLTQRIVRDVPALYHRQMLECLAVKTEAQDAIAEFMSSQLNASNDESAFYGINKEDILIKTARRMSMASMSMPFVAFLTYELSPASLDQFISQLTAAQRKILAGSHREHIDIDKNQSSLLAIMLYHQFWNQTIEERAAVINNLLMPGSAVDSEKAANAAYQDAFQYICRVLFPENNPENEMSMAFLTSYLDVSNEHVRPYLLTAVLSANKMTQGKHKNMTTTLPRLAEAMGAAGVKAGQAAHSYPKTPKDIRDALAHLKSQSRLPCRWELWKLIKAAIPEDLLLRIKRVKGLLGGASFYVAVEVEMHDGKTAVLRLMREKAEAEAKYGFTHLRTTIEHCRHPGIMEISRDLAHIINEAEAGAGIEIDHLSVARQYQIATAIYQNPAQCIKIKDQIYHVKIRPVQLFSQGPGYQLISKAEGIEFNDLKQDPQKQALCQAVALAICSSELRHMLGSGPCDSDRHGAQSRISCHESAPGVFDVLVTHYDFGEISPTPATPAQLRHCHDFMNDVASHLFSKWNLFRLAVKGDPGASLMEQLAERMLGYIREHTLSGAADDLSRLRGIFKGLLALNDFFEVLATDKALALQIKSVFDEHLESSSPSFSLSGLFSGIASPASSSTSCSADKNKGFGWFGGT